MERLKIPLNSPFYFSTIITIRITDLNYGGHVGNDVFLSLIHEARQQFLQHHGFSELSFSGIGLIMADAAIEFKRELNYRDQVRISVSASGFDRLGFDLFYLMETKVGEEWLTAGKAKTGMTCYDYSTRKKVQTPQSAIIKLTNPEPSNDLNSQ